MGDRTTCYLDIGGAIPRSLANRIMSGEFGHDESDSLLPTAEEANGGPWNLTFYEVNYGNIDPDLESALIAASVPWRWSWDAGGCFGSGARWWVPGMASPAETVTSDGAEVVSFYAIRQMECEHPGLLVSELLEKLAPMPPVPAATFIEDVPTIRLGPDPDPETFTLVGFNGAHRVIEAIDVNAAKAAAKAEGFDVAGVVKGRAIVLGA